MAKKGQAAMEFLMTYGWAILVVLIAISALAYFGVLNPSRFLPESCTLVPGLSCMDFKADASDDTLLIIMQNGMGQDLYDVQMNISSAGCTQTPKYNLSDATSHTFNMTNCDFNVGQKLKANIIISFTSEAGISHEEMGQLITKVEE